MNQPLNRAQSDRAPRTKRTPLRARPGLYLLLCAVAACAVPAEPPAPERSAAPVTVRPRQVSGVSESAPLYVRAPDAVFVVAAPSEARVVRLLVALGAEVAAGAPVAEVVMPRAVEAAGAREAARVRLEAHQARQTQLGELRGQGLSRAVDESEARVRIAEARADLLTAEASLRAMGLDPSRAAQLLTGAGAVSLRAPSAGVLNHFGETVAVGAQLAAGAEVAQILAGGTPQLVAYVSRVPEAGTKLFAEIGGVRFPVRIRSAAPGFDPRDGTRTLWLEPDEPKSENLADAKAPITQLVAGAAGRLLLGTTVALALPASAVWLVPSDGGLTAIVALREGERFRAQTVRVAAEKEGEIWVQDLLESSEVALEPRAVLEGAE